ncbi:hypothetical protein F5B20DRAFT_595962 [Whalleya microplaca]|nr:hypothetical protein F5B20DRAFT_595962 [Whalleya microplaca]
MASPPPPPFGLLPAGHPLVTTPTSQPGPTSFLYTLPTATPANPKPFAHLAVFLLPAVALPPGTAAAIYVARCPTANPSTPPNFRFLGAVGAGKESAVFKLSPGEGGQGGAGAGAGGGGGGNGEGGGDGGVVMIGIEVEDASAVASRMATITTNNKPQHDTGVSTQAQVQLAQRIIQNAFNFLSGFSGQVGAGGVEVVPLRAFQDWWRKFEARIRSDPTFLERGQD